MATLTAARTESETTLSSARAEAEALTNASAAERARLDAEGNERRNAIDEDFEIAISARRADAHQRLTEREELSVADAKQRIADATAEAEHRVQEATDHSAELIRRAAAESHQRVAEADQAVQELTSLRSHVLDQLASLRDHLGQVDKLAASAPALLDPPDTEARRPVTADFPVDPQDRPTGLPESYDKDPGPWDEVSVESVRAELADQKLRQPGRRPAQRRDRRAGQGFRVRGAASGIRGVRHRHLPEGGGRAAPAEPNTSPSVPNQQRSGIRAFAERAMGGR